MADKRKLTEAELDEVHAEFMRELSRTRTVIGPITKQELRARIAALDADLAKGKYAELDLPAPTEQNFKTRAAFDANELKFSDALALIKTAINDKRTPPAPRVSDQAKEGRADGLR